MQNIFTSTGQFEGNGAYELLDPIDTTVLAQVLAETEASSSGNSSASILMELSYAPTNDDSVGGGRIAGAQAHRLSNQSLLHCQVMGWQVIPAFQPAMFRMRVFPFGAVDATLIRLSVLRSPI
ncbi:MAG: hypothetical protein AAF066_17585 [Pseudomonadota bacterium]